MELFLLFRTRFCLRCKRTNGQTYKHKKYQPSLNSGTNANPDEYPGMNPVFIKTEYVPTSLISQPVPKTVLPSGYIKSDRQCK